MAIGGTNPILEQFLRENSGPGSVMKVLSAILGGNVNPGLVANQNPQPASTSGSDAEAGIAKDLGVDSVSNNQGMWDFIQKLPGQMTDAYNTFKGGNVKGTTAATPNADQAMADQAKQDQANSLRASASTKAKTGATPTVDETARVVADTSIKKAEQQGIVLTPEQQSKMEAQAIDFVNRMSEGKRIDLLTAGLGILSSMDSRKSPANVIGAGMLAGVNAASADRQQAIKNVLDVRQQQIQQQQANNQGAGVNVDQERNAIISEDSQRQAQVAYRGQDIQKAIATAHDKAIMYDSELRAAATQSLANSNMKETDLKISAGVLGAVDFGDPELNKGFQVKYADAVKRGKALGFSNEQILSEVLKDFNSHGGKTSIQHNWLGGGNNKIDANQDNIISNVDAETHDILKRMHGK